MKVYCMNCIYIKKPFMAIVDAEYTCKNNKTWETTDCSSPVQEHTEICKLCVITNRDKNCKYYKEKP